MKRKKLPKIKKLEKELKKLVNEYVYKRDGSRCQKCGKLVSGKNRHSSHVIPKGGCKYLRWDVQNIKTMCMRHHLQWWHLNPTESGLWFPEEFPERHEYLQERKNKTLSVELRKQGKTIREYLNEKIKLIIEELGG